MSRGARGLGGTRGAIRLGATVALVTWVSVAVAACGSGSSGVADAGLGSGLSSGGPTSSGSGTAEGDLGDGAAAGSSGGSSGAMSGGAPTSTPVGSPGSTADGSVATEGGTGDATGTSAADAAPACTKQITSSMDCTAPIAPGDQKHCMLGSRSYYLYVPKTFDPCVPAAVVIDAHGATQTAQSQLYGKPPFCVGASTCWNGPGSGWRLESETPGGGFILITPDSSTSANTWDTTADPMYMIQLIAQIKTVATVDPKKIYMTGISNGAQLTYVTACTNPGTFAGISPNSGGVLGGTQCSGLMTPQVDIQFDDTPDFAFSDSQSTVTAMAMSDGCKSGPSSWTTFGPSTTDDVCLLNPDDNATTLVPCNTITPAVQPTTCQIWDQCNGGVKVVFCQVAAGTLHGSANSAIDGHIIYENNTHLNTPSVAWRFFKSFW